MNRRIAVLENWWELLTPEEKQECVNWNLSVYVPHANLTLEEIYELHYTIYPETDIAESYGDTRLYKTLEATKLGLIILGVVGVVVGILRLATV